MLSAGLFRNLFTASRASSGLVIARPLSAVHNDFCLRHYVTHSVNIPQHRDYPTLIEKCVGSFKLPETRQSGCWKYNGNCILKSCFPRKNKITLPLGKARKCELASCIIFSPLKLSPRLTRFFHFSCGRTRRRRLPKWILLTFYLCSVL